MIQAAGRKGRLEFRPAGGTSAQSPIGTPAFAKTANFRRCRPSRTGLIMLQGPDNATRKNYAQPDLVRENNPLYTSSDIVDTMLDCLLYSDYE